MSADAIVAGAILVVIVAAFIIDAMTPDVAPQRPSAEDWKGYPFDEPERVVYYQPAPEPEPAPRAHARAWVDEEAVTYEVATGEVVDELDGYLTPVKQIGQGR